MIINLVYSVFNQLYHLLNLLVVHHYFAVNRLKSRKIIRNDMYKMNGFIKQLTIKCPSQMPIYCKNMSVCRQTYQHCENNRQGHFAYCILGRVPFPNIMRTRYPQQHKFLKRTRDYMEATAITEILNNKELNDYVLWLKYYKKLLQGLGDLVIQGDDIQ